MIVHGKAKYKQYDTRPVDQELRLGGGREVSVQRDLPESTNRREWQFGESLAI